MHGLQIVKRVISVTHGSEGPRHDPYAYMEIQVIESWRRPDGFEFWKAVTLHDGLASWVKDGKHLITDREEHVPDVFRMLTGMTIRQAVRYELRAKFRCRCGNTKRFNAVDGFPGEILYQCVRCDNIVAGDFNLSAII